MKRLLLCTDLDRTLIPNGDKAESAQARIIFCKLVSQPQVTLIYVTGRHQQLVRDAIQEYQLPQPDYVISDVGSTIYQLTSTDWQHQKDWEDIIKSDWKNRTAHALHELLDGISELRLQEASKQNKFKLSYYLSLDSNHNQIMENINKIFKQHAIKANLIYSIDQQQDTGLLDVLPASAGKQQAIEFLMKQLGFDLSEIIFAGDSGNDLCVLTSPIPSVLVANADDDVRHAAIVQSQAKHNSEALYLAKGGFMDMNGNYSAGILEGVVHYIPQAVDWLRGKS